MYVIFIYIYLCVSYLLKQYINNTIQLETII